MKYLLATTALLATISTASAGDRTCEGYLRIGHGSNSDNVYVMQEDKDEPLCWFDYRLSSAKKILSTCDDVIGFHPDSIQVCKIVGTVRQARLGKRVNVPKITSVKSVQLHDVIH
jgi:hypothetical protein